MNDLPAPSFSLAAVAGLLRWTAEFSGRLDRDRAVEMRMATLRFVAQGFSAVEPGFDLEPLARGEQPPGAPAGGVTLVALIQAFRYLDEHDDDRGVTASMIIWHLVARPRASAADKP